MQRHWAWVWYGVCSPRNGPVGGLGSSRPGGTCTRVPSHESTFWTKRRTTRHPKKGSEQILRHEIAEGRIAIRRPVFGLFLSGISAGLDIGFSLFLMAVMRTQVEGTLPPRPSSRCWWRTCTPWVSSLWADGRSELFTEQTTLAVLPVLNRKASVGELARTWAAGLRRQPHRRGRLRRAPPCSIVLALRRIDRRGVFGEIATSADTATPTNVILLSGILAGWLMGLVSWLVAAVRDTISQIVLTWMITTVIGPASPSTT